ncbi:MAG: hypothetical protein WAL67_15095 [Candidatus Cybelea sp.]
MIHWLGTLPTVTAAIVVVGGFILVSNAIGYLVGKCTSQQVRTAHNDRAGFILAVIGVIYAVLLAFVAIGAWERFQQAEARSYEEAGALATIFRDADSFPHAAKLREMLRAYVRSVVVDEWPRMRDGGSSRASEALLEAADRNIRALPAGSFRLDNIDAQMLAAMDVALNDRDARLTEGATGINSIMWAVLMLGAFVTVSFTYLFGFDKTVMQQLMIGGLSFMIGLVLFLIVALDFPFRGSIAVGPEAFRTLLETFNAIGS